MRQRGGEDDRDESIEDGGVGKGVMCGFPEPPPPSPVAKAHTGMEGGCGVVSGSGKQPLRSPGSHHPDQLCSSSQGPEQGVLSANTRL